MQVLELIGVFAFAVSGALMAIDRDFDVVGIAILAVVTALGGPLRPPHSSGGGAARNQFGLRGCAGAVEQPRSEVEKAS